MFLGGTWTKYWLKLDYEIRKCTNPATGWTFIATLAKTNININKKEQDLQLSRQKSLQLVTLVRNGFLQRCISSTFAKKSFL